MSTYTNDRHAGDNNWNRPMVFFLPSTLKFRRGRDREIQIRNQTSNILHPEQMFPTIRYRRDNSLSREQKDIY